MPMRNLASAIVFFWSSWETRLSAGEANWSPKLLLSSSMRTHASRCRIPCFSITSHKKCLGAYEPTTYSRSVLWPALMREYVAETRHSLRKLGIMHAQMPRSCILVRSPRSSIRCPKSTFVMACSSSMPQSMSKCIARVIPQTSFAWSAVRTDVSRWLTRASSKVLALLFPAVCSHFQRRMRCVSELMDTPRPRTQTHRGRCLYLESVD
mmetsp:Transcript_6134/g.14607  ORF Transcript_6134/g.14607 Transcript_6134/m.14607 type:complete len:209 (+) Transcript_6134:318-944(+)